MAWQWRGGGGASADPLFIGRNHAVLIFVLLCCTVNTMVLEVRVVLPTPMTGDWKFGAEI